jgi:hypothetical protein
VRDEAADVAEGVQHAALEVRIGRFLAAVPVGTGDQLRLLGDEHRAEDIGIDLAQRPPHPHVEEVRQVSIANHIIIRWISCNNA